MKMKRDLKPLLSSFLAFGIVVSTVQMAFPKTIQAENTGSLKLSVSDGTVLRGTSVLDGYSKDLDSHLSLSIDGKQTGAPAALRSSVKLVFEADGLDRKFYHAVKIGDQLAKSLYLDNSVYNWETVEVEIPQELLMAGVPNTISFWAGSQKTTNDVRGTNDDYDVRNVRLVFADGTEVRDPNRDPNKPPAGNGNFREETIKYSVGDNSSTTPIKQDFTFEIPPQPPAVLAAGFTWDTNQVKDGEHLVELTADKSGIQQKAQARVIVDNTAPAIKVDSPVQQEYRSDEIHIDAAINDATSGIKKSEVRLDGKLLQVPAILKTRDIGSGQHTLQVTAADKAGNQNQAEVQFSAVPESPDTPTKPMPALGTVLDSTYAALSVNVSDPTNDGLAVEFYKADTLHFLGGGGIQGAMGLADEQLTTEPDVQGAAHLNAEHYKLANASDDQYLINESRDKLPYQRFDYIVNEKLDNVNSIDVNWEGHSLPGRVVSLSAWDYTTNTWREVASGKGSKDFTLTGKLDVQSMVRNKKVQILVQNKVTTTDPYDFSFAWMTDTQYYSQNRPAIFESMTKWVSDYAKERKIDYTLHTGDIVQNWNNQVQWQRASSNMKMLEDAGVPYGVTPGNHDNNWGNNHEFYGQYFGSDRFAGQSYYGGTYKNNENHYDLISTANNDFIILYMGFKVDPDEIEWANQILAKYSDRNAILALHEYVHPKSYYTGQGLDIYEKVVKPNNNIFAVLCGHTYGANYWIKDLGTRKVIEMVANYQDEPLGGAGYMRLLQFDSKNQKINFDTYSPYKDDYNYYEDGRDDFTLDTKLTPGVKQIATDAVNLTVRSKDKIGTVNVPSGSTAAVAWNDLKKNEEYSWYTVVKDAFGGVTESDVWQFRTGKSEASRDKR